MIQNTDIFTPIVDDPYIQGKIAACNVTNDVFACGVIDIKSVLCFLAAPIEIPKSVLSEVLRGFQDFLEDISAGIVGGHTIINPWFLIGGTATGFVEENHLIRNDGVKDGDILILTKPLGVQPAMAVFRVMKRPEFLSNITDTVPEAELQEIVDKAVQLMVTSNRPVIQKLRELAETTSGKFKVHAMTDVTGFGLAGHAENLAVASGMDIEITQVPHIKWTMELSDLMGYDMDNARAAETAGGMLICVAETDKDLVINALKEACVDHFIVGKAKKGTGKVTLSKNIEFVAV
jgi:selenide,water dikinase